MFFNLLNTQAILFYILFFIPSLTIHEFSHGFIAYKLGDNTAKSMGRLTLNPLAHLDLIGTIAIFLIGFGWAKPVPINPYNFKNIRRDTALVSLAGPASNFIMAGVSILLLNIFGLSSNTLLFNILAAFAQINIILGLFNLLPLGPLDGFKIVSGFLPTELAIKWEETQQLTYILLIIFLILPINGQTIVSYILDLASNLFWNAIP
jgi:Zn-dependent protease